MLHVAWCQSLVGAQDDDTRKRLFRRRPSQMPDAQSSSVLWLLLRGVRKRASDAHARIVLLHGWLQAHDCWLQTATHHGDKGHDVLLLDFYGHGGTKVPSAASMSLHHWTMLVAERIKAVGWADGPQISIVGCSMGAATAGSVCVHASGPRRNAHAGDAAGLARIVVYAVPPCA